jgi:hypothetical protein
MTTAKPHRGKIEFADETGSRLERGLAAVSHE